MNIQNLEQRLQIMRRSEGLIGGTLKVKAIKPENGHLAAHIDLNKWGAEFSVDPEWKPEDDETLQIYASIKDIDDVVVEASKALLKHEIGHWKFCPYDFENHDKILDSVNKGLEAAKLEEGLRKQWLGYVANMFEDLVLNSNREREGKFDGQFVFFYDQGTTVGTYTPLYEVHVKLHDRLFNDSLKHELVSRFYSENADGQHPLSKTISKRIGQIIDEKVNNIITNVLNVKDLSLDEAVAVMNEKEKWGTRAYEFAKSVAEFISTEKPQEQLAGGFGFGTEKDQEGDQSGSSQGADEDDSDKQSAGGSGDQDNEEKVQGKGTGNEGEKEEDKHEILGPDPSSFEDEFDDERTQRKVVLGRYKAGIGLPSYRKPSESYDHLYSALATEIILKAKTRREGWEMPIAVASHEQFDPEEHKPSDIDFSRFSIDPERTMGDIIGFEVPNHHHTVQVPFRKGKERLPDIMYLFDCSGSMSGSGGQTIPWDNGGYHFALLGIYGSLKWLQREGLAPYIKYNSTFFSNSTESSGWNDYAHLNEVKKLFWKPQFGGTTIDMNVLREQLARKDPSIVLMLSDGAIYNWYGIKEEFKSITEGHMLSFIQTGGQTQTGEDIKSWGKPVYDVNGKDDLDKLIVDLTKGSVRGFRERMRAMSGYDSGYIFRGRR